MYIVHVIPILRAIGVETLSYFSVRVVRPGSIISVPVRGKQCKALVVKVEEVQNVRQSIRTQDFQLQKIGPDAPSNILIPESVAILDTLAQIHLTTAGAVMHGLIAQDLLNFPMKEAPERRKTETVFEHIPVQQSLSERTVIYKNTIRESLAKNESVLFIVPERADVLSWSETLSLGVSKYIVPIHGGLSKKIIKERIARVVEDPHALAIVTTPKFMMLPRIDVGTIIVERESSDSFVMRERPHLDLRVCIEQLARSYGAKYFSGDSLLRMRTLKAVAEHKTDPRVPLATHARGIADVTIITKQKEDRAHVFGDELRTKLTTELDGGHNVAIICARKGYATTVVCGDCGKRVSCSTCGHGVRLVVNTHATQSKKEDSRVFMCERCGTTENAHTTCTQCDSWKLVSLGFGMDRIKDACTHYFPGVPVFVVNETDEPKESVLKKWHESKGSIVLLSKPHIHLLKETGAVVIPSLEAALSIPTADADESLVRTLTYSKEITTHVIYIQTHATEHPLAQTLVSGELSAWVRDELAMRKQLKLPPFTNTVTATITGKKMNVIDAVAAFLKLVAPWKPKPFAELVRVSPTHVSHTTKLNIPVQEWPNKRLHEAVRSLSPEWDIAVEL
jgi:primosomal protein N'